MGEEGEALAGYMAAEITKNTGDTLLMIHLCVICSGNAWARPHAVRYMSPVSRR